MGIVSKNILLADDNPVNQQVASRMLRKMGHEVDIVQSGVEAIAEVGSKQYALVLMDIMMPEMDGLTATREICKQMGSERPPIVALTAHADPGHERKCLEAGMDGFISKPFTIEQLRVCVEEFVDSKVEVSSDTLNLPVFQTFLKTMGEDDLEFISDLFSDFLNEANRVRTEIQLGIEGKDRDVIARACHSLKGSAAILGASSLKSASEDIEHLSKLGKLEDITLRMSHFEGCINEIRSVLDAQIESLSLASTG